jgi:hypothetical protein
VRRKIREPWSNIWILHLSAWRKSCSTATSYTTFPKWTALILKSGHSSDELESDKLLLMKSVQERGSTPGRGKNIYFFSPPPFQTGFGAHPASYPMGARGSFSGGEADHLPPCSAEVKNAWGYTSTLPHVFMAWYLIKHRIRLDGVVIG